MKDRKLEVIYKLIQENKISIDEFIILMNSEKTFDWYPTYSVTNNVD